MAGVKIVCDLFVENFIHHLRLQQVKKYLFNDFINDKTNSCALLLIRTLKNVVQGICNEHPDFLGDELLHCAGNLYGNHPLDFNETRDDIVDF